MFQNLNESVFDENYSPLKPIGIAPRMTHKQGVKRKFPGPAGLLPEIDTTRINNPETVDIPCSQATVSLFHSAIWNQVTTTYQELLDRYNIKQIRDQVRQGHLHQDQRTPFLAAFIQSIDCCESVINICLRDQSGEIQGTIAKTAYEKYIDCLRIGAVIVIKKIGILISGSQYHLIITLNNLIAIYMNKLDGSGVELLQIQDSNRITEELTPPENIHKPSYHFKKLHHKDDYTYRAPFRNMENSPKHTKPEKKTQLNFDVDFDFPDDFDEDLISIESSLTCEEVTQDKIWQDALNGIDLDSITGDF